MVVQTFDLDVVLFITLLMSAVGFIGGVCFKEMQNSRYITSLENRVHRQVQEIADLKSQINNPLPSTKLEKLPNSPCGKRI